VAVGTGGGSFRSSGTLVAAVWYAFPLRLWASRGGGPAALGFAWDKDVVLRLVLEALWWLPRPSAALAVRVLCRLAGRVAFALNIFVPVVMGVIETLVLVGFVRQRP